jgi:hypothetical protein
LRNLRIAVPVQPSLALPDDLRDATDRWWSLPEQSRSEVLTLLARLIARGIVCEGETDERL